MGCILFFKSILFIIYFLSIVYLFPLHCHGIFIWLIVSYCGITCIRSHPLKYHLSQLWECVYGKVVARRLELRHGELGLLRSRAMASLGVRGGLKEGGKSGFYGWQSSRSIVRCLDLCPDMPCGVQMAGWNERRGGHATLSLLLRRARRAFLFTCSPCQDLSLTVSVFF